MPAWSGRQIEDNQFQLFQGVNIEDSTHDAHTELGVIYEVCPRVKAQ